ncbi:hypothetical protein KIN20_032048 [Parelaphostrongylus tenuis]|uniref:Uncharacterized protein n=1 Tax=Parelaphostrongylus tenuis TaxID=148309 RepID=A0AAD5WHR8_PARTN|nr:hypothetical protein KIN20_032048 [Parelaphostrongylus tenuis]
MEARPLNNTILGQDAPPSGILRLSGDYPICINSMRLRITLSLQLSAMDHQVRSIRL